MKYSEVRDTVRGLRELADFVEAHGLELPGSFELCSGYNFLFDDVSYSWDPLRHPKTAREKARIIAKLLGKADKVYEGNYLELHRRFGSILVQFNVARDKVCERRVVEVIEHPEEIVLRPAYTEEIVEWVCDEPLLKVEV